MDYQRQYPERRAQRKANILHLLSECLTDIPMTETLSPIQKEAALTLQTASEENVAADRSFYEHILASRDLNRNATGPRMKLGNNGYV